MNPQQRLFYFLAAISAASREHGVIITGQPDFEIVEKAEGAYALNPNADGPAIGWRSTGREQG